MLGLDDLFDAQVRGKLIGSLSLWFSEAVAFVSGKCAADSFSSAMAILHCI